MEGCCNWDGGGGCDLVEGEDFEVGGGGGGGKVPIGVVGLGRGGGEEFEVGGDGGGEVATGGFVGLGRGGAGVFLGGDPDPPPPALVLPPHFDLLQSTGRADGEEHSLEDRWSVFAGIQFWRPSAVTEAQTGGVPVK